MLQQLDLEWRTAQSTGDMTAFYELRDLYESIYGKLAGPLGEEGRKHHR